MKNLKSKSISIPICCIGNDNILNYTICVSCNKNNGNMYLASYFRYKEYSIYARVRKPRFYKVNKEVMLARKEKERIIENKIKEEMKKDKNISRGRLCEITGLSRYKIDRYYVRIRREIM